MPGKKIHKTFGQSKYETCEGRTLNNGGGILSSCWLSQNTLRDKSISAIMYTRPTSLTYAMKSKIVTPSKLYQNEVFAFHSVATMEITELGLESHTHTHQEALGNCSNLRWLISGS